MIQCEPEALTVTVVGESAGPPENTVTVEFLVDPGAADGESVTVCSADRRG